MCRSGAECGGGMYFQYCGDFIRFGVLKSTSNISNCLG